MYRIEIKGRNCSRIGPFNWEISKTKCAPPPPPPKKKRGGGNRHEHSHLWMCINKYIQNTPPPLKVYTLPDLNMTNISR